jgi:hypothetical protein
MRRKRAGDSRTWVRYIWKGGLDIQGYATQINATQINEIRSFLI